MYSFLDSCKSAFSLIFLSLPLPFWEFHCSVMLFFNCYHYYHLLPYVLSYKTCLFFFLICFLLLVHNSQSYYFCFLSLHLTLSSGAIFINHSKVSVPVRVFPFFLLLTKEQKRQDSVTFKLCVEFKSLSTRCTPLRFFFNGVSKFPSGSFLDVSRASWCVFTLVIVFRMRR